MDSPLSQIDKNYALPIRFERDCKENTKDASTLMAYHLKGGGFTPENFENTISKFSKIIKMELTLILSLKISRNEM